MKDIVVTADSTCDLSQEIIDRYKVNIIPLYVNMGETFYKDGVDVHPSDLFTFVAKTGQLPKTSAVSVADYYNVFSKFEQEGKAVIHINISSGFSSCYQNACIAASELTDVYVVDSANLSTGTGHLVIEAAQLAQQGMDAKNIAENLRKLAPKIESSFVIDKLDFLKMGGRCSSLAAFGASLLNIKPCIEVKDGFMHVGKKYRGTIEKSISDYVIDRLKNRKDIDKRRIFITHTCTNEIALKVKELVRQCMDFDEIFITTAGCTISSHCGPGTLGVLFIRK
ncbi:MAG: DegV family protein [Bacillota bacterium]|nr:DegV family protein [Bacillota bacterium]